MTEGTTAEAVVAVGGEEYRLFFACGVTLLEIVDMCRSKAGLDSPCGGKGTCGKCRVYASGELSAPDENERRLLGAEAIAGGLRLACHARAEGDVRITLPDVRGTEIREAGYAAEYRPDPIVRRVSVALGAPTLLDQTDDAGKAEAASGAAFTLSALRRFRRVIAETGGRADLIVHGTAIIGAEKPGDGLLLGMAADIGTTTVVCYFYDLESGNLLETLSALNRQKLRGADVISRINHCIENPDGLNELQGLIIDQLNGFIGEFCSRRGISRDCLRAAVIAGNTTMAHLACGIDPSGIANAPFAPATRFGFTCRAAEMGLSLGEGGIAVHPKAFSGYVGSDITAGLCACGLDETKDCELFVDIGTNGEMALSADGVITTCSTAAGPAFEGAHIRCGMGGVAGAVSGVEYKDGKINLTAVAGSEPLGICGSGLLDAIALMLRLGVVDETGRLLDPDEVPDGFPTELLDLLSEDGGEPCFFLNRERGIFISQKDIREVQLAKAAVAAGIYTLLDASGKTAGDVEKVWIAGGFGSYMKKESAVAVGLLPRELLPKIETAGNAAGMGAVRILLDKSVSEKIPRMCGRAKYVELSASPYFLEKYIDCMAFE